MSFSENIHRLHLFGIPPENSSDNAGRVRNVLARLVEAESLSLSDLQTARDIVRRFPDAPAETYLFLAAMFLSVADGNTFLRPEKGWKVLMRGGHLDEGDAVREYGEEAFSADVAEVWPAAASAAKALDGEIVLRRHDDNGDCWFFQRNANAVDAVSKAFSALAAQEPCASTLSDGELAAATAFKDFELDGPQRKAVESAVTRRFTVVTGGPGTGKTTIVCSILRALIARGLSTEDIALVAPTGRAAQRMGESLREQCAGARGLDEALRLRIESLKGSTIHSLLGGFPPNWKYTADNRLPLKLVVVDESSMVDVMLMRALIEALPDDCRLVLLGDRDQLPSVEVGAVLGDIVDGGATSCVVRLGASKRFAEEIARCAEAINAGDVPGFLKNAGALPADDDSWPDRLKSSGTGCFRLPLTAEAEKRRDACHAAVVRWAGDYGLLTNLAGGLVALASRKEWKDDPALTNGILSENAKALFEALVRSRILVVVRRGPYGVKMINDLLVAKRFGKTPSNELSKAGVPVIVTRNTPNHACGALFNGDIGVTVKGPAGMVVLFKRGDKVVSCPIALLPEHELAYAITVHKSQGSEYGNVLVVLPDDKAHPLISRQLLYTAVTRAKERAVILGMQEAIEAAIGNDQKRDTGIVLAATRQ